jgi:hypothetical protein
MGNDNSWDHDDEEQGFRVWCTYHGLVAWRSEEQQAISEREKHFSRCKWECLVTRGSRLRPRS